MFKELQDMFVGASLPPPWTTFQLPGHMQAVIDNQESQTWLIGVNMQLSIASWMEFFSL